MRPAGSSLTCSSVIAASAVVVRTLRAGAPGGKLRLADHATGCRVRARRVPGECRMNVRLAAMKPVASRIAALSGEGALSIFARAKELEGQGRSIIHLELGEPDFHPAEPVIHALEEALRAGKDRYCTVAGVPALREELARYLDRTRGLDVSSGNIVVAPGCKIALFLAMMAIVEPGDEVLYPDPGFPGYPSITAGMGGVPVPYELAERNQFQPDPDEIAAKITARTKAVLTCSPNNPTGTVYTDDAQRRIAELA